MKFDGKPLTGKDAIKYLNLKKDTLKRLGITNYVATRKFKDINEILNSDTGMVTAQCTKDTIINNSLSLKKGGSYVMPLTMFVSGYKNKDKSNVYFTPAKKTFSELFKRYRGQDLTNKKVLISRAGGLGDLIVSQSVIKAIKTKYPSCKITYATTPEFIDLFTSFPKGLIDGVASIPYNSNLLSEYDYHILFISSIENCIETQNQNYYDIFQKVTGLDYNARDYLSTLEPNPSIVKQLKEMNIVKKNTILLHMASSTLLRSYPNDKWAKIILLLTQKGYNVGVIDSSSKGDAIRDFLTGIPGLDTTKAFNFAAISHTISHGIAIYSQCLGGITIDSSFAHISGALRKPSVALCGPYPSYNVVGAYETVAGLNADSNWNSCGKNPCFLNSQQHLCPYIKSNLNPGCLDSISPELIVNTLEEKIKSLNPEAFSGILPMNSAQCVLK